MNCPLTHTRPYDWVHSEWIIKQHRLLWSTIIALAFPSKQWRCELQNYIEIIETIILWFAKFCRMLINNSYFDCKFRLLLPLRCCIGIFNRLRQMTTTTTTRATKKTQKYIFLSYFVCVKYIGFLESSLVHSIGTHI